MKEVLTFIDWFDQGDPLHRRRRMSSYGATMSHVFPFSPGFLVVNQLDSDSTSSRRYHLPWAICLLPILLWIESRDPRRPKIPGFPVSFLFSNLEDNRHFADELRSFNTRSQHWKRWLDADLDRNIRISWFPRDTQNPCDSQVLVRRTIFLLLMQHKKPYQNFVIYRTTRMVKKFHASHWTENFQNLFLSTSTTLLALKTVCRRTLLKHGRGCSIVVTTSRKLNPRALTFSCVNLIFL